MSALWCTVHLRKSILIKTSTDESIITVNFHFHYEIESFSTGIYQRLIKIPTLYVCVWYVCMQ